MLLAQLTEAVLFFKLLKKTTLKLETYIEIRYPYVVLIDHFLQSNCH